MPKSGVTRFDEQDGRPLLTALGRHELLARVDDIRNRRLPEMRPMLVEAERDERVVADFERLTSEADTLDALVASAVILAFDPEAFDGRVGLGMRVNVVIDDESSWVRPVHQDEAFLDEERISASSPLAIALMGSRAGHTVWVDAPTGAWSCAVVSIETDA